jgi:chromosome segregation ATPase
MTSVKESIEYRLAIVEQQISILKLQQDDFKQLGKELNNLVNKTQMYDLSLSDMKEKLEDHKVMMRSLRDEIKAERTEFLVIQKEFQKESADRIEKSQSTLIKKLDELSETTDELRIHHAANKDKKNTILNLSEGTLQTLLRLILALVAIISGIYGVKLL